MKENQLLNQSLEFATKIIKLQKYLISQKKETIISMQCISQFKTNKKIFIESFLMWLSFFLSFLL